jgi:hypothetical protein
LLFFARDPGPANYLVAVHDLVTMPALDAGAAAHVVAQLRKQMPVIVYGRGAAMDIWRRAGILPLRLDQEIQADVVYSAKVASLTNLLHHKKTSCVVTGASDVDENTDHALWETARRLGIPSHSFLDHPASLERRFRKSDGTPILPDYIHAPDASYLPELARFLVPGDRVSVTGAIHGQRLQRITRGVSDEQRLRSIWGARRQDKVILFASECIQEMEAMGRSRGYSEFAVLDELTWKLEAGETIGSISAPTENLILVVRPHPRDRHGKYSSWRADGGRLRRVISDDGAPEQAILAADIVVGMESSLLRDAVALQRPAISLVGADLRV